MGTGTGTVDDRFESVLALLEERDGGDPEAAQLDDDVVEALARSGLNRSLVPASLGGTERDVREVVGRIMDIAARDASAAWCSAISAGSNHFAGYVPEVVARRTFDDPDAGGAGMFQPAGVVTVSADDGTAVLTGRWPFASNCVHSRWIGLGAWVDGADGVREPAPRLVIVPAKDVVIEDTWRGGGLRTTGSHHVRVESVVIDLERSCSFGDRPWPDGTLWRMPLFTVLAPLLAAVPLGVARRAVDRLHERITSGATAVRGPLADDAVGLAALAVVDAAQRAATAGLLDSLGDIAAAAARGTVERPLQARLMLAVLHACDVSVDATSVAHRLSGGAGAFRDHPVAVALRDVETVRQHVMFSHQHRPALMRVAAGINEAVPPFVL